MPTNDVRAHLARLYADSGDPWNTLTSAYEKEKFARTVASLPRQRYRRGLEVGCGAGALTALLAPRCDELIAMDCTPRALSAACARPSLATVSFVEGAAPDEWPTDPPDLVVLSEVLYFMTEAESAGLAQRLVRDCAPECEAVLVNWLGDTGGLIGGAAAAERLIEALSATHHVVVALVFELFRLDILSRTGSPAESAATFVHCAAGAPE